MQPARAFVAPLAPPAPSVPSLSPPSSSSPSSPSSSPSRPHHRRPRTTTCHGRCCLPRAPAMTATATAPQPRAPPPAEHAAFPIPRSARLGPLTLSPPVQLAPMAGVTTPVFRALCASHGAPLCTAEMLHADLYAADLSRGGGVQGGPGTETGSGAGTMTVTEEDAQQDASRTTGGGNRGKNKTKKKWICEDALFAARDTETTPRSAQLYGVHASTLARAARRLVDEHGVQHIDLNMGCPAPKVIRRGGGAALPRDAELLRGIAQAVRVAVPASVALSAKLRLGARGDVTYLAAARVLRDAGFDGVTLHARSAEQRYERGAARRQWGCVARLVREVGGEMSVFGNGDVFTAADARAMLAETGAHGVVIGRGALGRPWLFRDLAQGLRGGDGERERACEREEEVGGGAAPVSVPAFETVRDTLLRHVALEVQWLMEKKGVGEGAAVQSVRKWVGWYVQGYDVPGEWVRRMRAAADVGSLRGVAAELDARGVGVADLAAVTAERGKVGVQ